MRSCGRPHDNITGEVPKYGEKIAKIGLTNMILSLITNDETGFNKYLCHKMYEAVVAGLLTSRTGLKGMQNYLQR